MIHKNFKITAAAFAAACTLASPAHALFGVTCIPTLYNCMCTYRVPCPVNDPQDLAQFALEKSQMQEKLGLLQDIKEPGTMMLKAINGQSPYGIPGMGSIGIDLNGDGDFDHPAEHLFGGTSAALAPGPNALAYDVPCDAVPQGVSYARFRLSSTGGLAPTTGAALEPVAAGEIEDYTFQVKGVDFGDQIVVDGLGLLRVTDVYSTDKSEYAHSH